MKKKYIKIASLYFTVIITICLMVYILVVSVRPNPIVLNYNLPFIKNLNALVPQGWAFFTKDVQKDYFNIYKKDRTIVELKSADINQAFGLIRDNRVINHKIGTLIKEINDKYWYTYKGDIKKLPNDSLHIVTMTMAEPMIYGEYIIEKGNPLPYAWYKSSMKITMENNYILIKIKPVEN